MKTVKLSLLLIFLLYSAAGFLFASGEGTIDRNHWRNLKKGLRYDDTRGAEKFNRNWADKAERGNKNSANQSEGGFGKYSRKSVGSGDGIGKRNTDGIRREQENDTRREPVTFTRKRSGTPWDLSPLAYIFIVLGVIGLIVVIFYMICQMDLKRNKKVIREEEETEETDQDPVELPRSELDILLENALRNGNYREAVRILFIFLIKSLREKDFIQWEKKKTNAHYLNEVSRHALFPRFSQAVLLFEVVWYGKRNLEKEQYHKVEPLFRALIKEVEQQPRNA